MAKVGWHQLYQLELLLAQEYSRLCSIGGLVAGHISLNHKIRFNSLEFSGKLSPFDQNTVVGPLVVLKFTHHSLLVKMLF